MIAPGQVEQNLKPSVVSQCVLHDAARELLPKAALPTIYLDSAAWDCRSTEHTIEWWDSGGEYYNI